MILRLPWLPKLFKAEGRSPEPAPQETASPDAKRSVRYSSRFEAWPQLLWPLLGVALVTAALLLLDLELAAELVPIAYLIPVMFAATQWGLWPGTLTSIASMAAADFFFFPPIYSFVVEDPHEAVYLVLFLIVALVSSNLAARLRRETEMLRQREGQIQRLYEFSRRLAACFTVNDLISAIQHYLSRTLGQQAAFFVATSDGHYEPSELKSVPSEVRECVAAMIVAIGKPDRTIVDQSNHDVWLLKAMSSENSVHGVITVNIGRGLREAINSRIDRAESVLEEVSLTFKRLDIGKAMEDARLHVQKQLLRDAFHGTLSHELCSPLAGIQGSASVLASMPAVQDDVQAGSLVEAISEEVARLNDYIQNLLNATRITAGGLNPRLEWADPGDIVNAAIKRRERKLASHRVAVELAPDLPLINVDSGLIEESCGQLLENAAKYSPVGSTISIDVRAESERLIVSVSDQGIGLAPDDQPQLGRRLFRSQRHQGTIPGSGLGLWIASTFVRANGGAVTVTSDGRGQGTTVSISLPCSQISSSESTVAADE